MIKNTSFLKKSLFGFLWRVVLSLNDSLKIKVSFLFGAAFIFVFDSMISSSIRTFIERTTEEGTSIRMCLISSWNKNDFPYEMEADAL
jgi:hypothetical protein